MSQCTNTLKYIDDRYSSPLHLQIGVQGEWGVVPKIDLRGKLASDVTMFADERIDESVAVEIFYELADKSFCFVGIKYGPTVQPQISPRTFCRALFFAAQSTQSPRELLTHLEQSVYPKPASLLEKNVDFASIFVLDYWKKLDVSTVWRHDEDLPSVSDLEQAITPTLRATDKNFIVLELDFGAPLWIGFQVSNCCIGDEYVSEPKKIHSILEHVLPSVKE